MDFALPPERVLRLVERPDFDQATSSRHIFRFRSAVYHSAQHPYLLRVGDSPDELLANRSRFLRILRLFVPLATLISAAIGWWIAAWALRPLRELKNAVDKINITQLERRLPLRGKADELEAVSKAFGIGLCQMLALIPNVQLGSGSEGPAIRGQDTTGALQALPAFLGGNRPRTTLIVDGRAVSYHEFVFGAQPFVLRTE